MSTRLVEVVDAHVDIVEPGQQEQTMRAAAHAVQNVDGAIFAIVLSYVPKADGTGYMCEAGVCGEGPRGFSGVVAESMSAAVAPIREMMKKQEGGW